MDILTGATSPLSLDKADVLLAPLLQIKHANNLSQIIRKLV